MSKQYGLILPNRNKKPMTSVTTLKKPSIFESDSDSDDSGGRPTGISIGLKRQDKEIQNKAIEEDPTIFQYDELYDEMDLKRKESKLSRKDLDKKPKYISNLLKAAEKRKLENERRIERQVQREREAEGNEFKDKEQFVTAAYKKKLEEMRQQEELEKREEYLEAIGDVTKQGNLDGFYRHLYEQKVNYDEDKEKKMEDIKTAVKTDSPNGDNKTIIKENDEKCTKPEKRRQYRRKRSHSQSDDDAVEVNTTQSHLVSNLDADSDFSIDSDSDDDNTKDNKQTNEVGEPKEKQSKSDENVVQAESTLIEKKDDSDVVIPAKIEQKVEDIKPKKPKIDIWKKRTVGVVFDEALQRYYERKALRESG